MLRPAAVTWSNVPVIVTFGAGGPAGACAKTGGASIARMTKASAAVRTLLLMTASSSGGEKHRIPCQHSTPTSPTTPERATDPVRSRTSEHVAADNRRARYGRGSGERGTPGRVQSDRWAWAKRIVAQRNGPDEGRVPFERTRRMSLGRDRRRGDEDDDVVEVGVIPEAGEPGQIGEIRVGQCSQTGKRPEQRNHDEPTHRHSDERHRAVLRVAPRDWRWRRQRAIVVRRRSRNTTMERHYKTGHLKKS